MNELSFVRKLDPESQDWIVYGPMSNILGVIRWAKDPINEYIFEPEKFTIYDASSLVDIAIFCRRQTNFRRNAENERQEK